MVAPIVPFVVGMLSNLAARKTKSEAAEAAKSVADYEYNQQVNLKNMEFTNARQLEFIKKGGTSMFTEFTTDLLPINMGGPNVTNFLNKQGPEFMYDLGIRTKLWGIKATTDGANASGKAFNWISQLNNISDDEWTYINNTYPNQANRIKAGIKGRVSLIDTDMRQTESGMAEGALNSQLLFGDYNSWIRGTIVGNIENETNKVFNSDNVLQQPPKEIPLSIADSWAFVTKNNSYDSKVDKKQANEYFSNVSMEVALFQTPLPQKENLNQRDNISNANGKLWMQAHPIQSVGFTQFAPIMLDKVYDNKGMLTDVRAKGIYDSPFSHPNLKNAANYVTNEAYKYADSKLTPGSTLHTLRKEGYHFNYLDTVYYQIDALASVAGPYDLPGSFVATGKDQGYGLLPAYADGTSFLEENFALTPTLIKGYRELARQGELALDNTRRQKELIDKLNLGGTFLTGAISLYEQVTTAGKDVVSMLTGAVDTGQFNTDLMNEKIDGQVSGIEVQMGELTTQIGSATGVTKTDLETRLKNLEATKSMLNKLKDTYLGIDMNDAYLKLDDYKDDENKTKAIQVARLALLRGGLVFYAAAIFQGEGGKAISDGDRELVTRALAVSPFTTKEQALAALDEFDLGMASIVGRAERIGNGNIQQKWAALNYTSVYPMLNDSSNSLDREKLPNAQIWRAQVPENIRENTNLNDGGQREPSENEITVSKQTTKMNNFLNQTAQTKKSLGFLLSKEAVTVGAILPTDQKKLQIFADTNELEY